MHTYLQSVNSWIKGNPRKRRKKRSEPSPSRLFAVLLRSLLVVVFNEPKRSLRKRASERGGERSRNQPPRAGGRLRRIRSGRKEVLHTRFVYFLARGNEAACSKGVARTRADGAKLSSRPFIFFTHVCSTSRKHFRRVSDERKAANKWTRPSPPLLQMTEA